IDDAPVSRNARNLVTAMPAFASSAAMTARVLPSVDMRRRLPGGLADRLSRAGGEGEEDDHAREADQRGGDVEHGDQPDPSRSGTSDHGAEKAEHPDRALERAEDPTAVRRGDPLLREGVDSDRGTDGHGTGNGRERHGDPEDRHVEADSEEHAGDQR